MNVLKFPEIRPNDKALISDKYRTNDHLKSQGAPKLIKS